MAAEANMDRGHGEGIGSSTVGRRGNRTVRERASGPRPRPLSKGSPWAAALAALAIGGCTFATTPAQDLAYQRWAECRSPTSGAQLGQIDAAGRIRFQALTHERQEILGCLARASAAGPPLPDPIATAGREGGP
ncbi:MAG: hypothetical protein L0027_13475 [Candidatus Rokubacteria bacterium]|nr:hypothetical protein [Candidatus Rokubacteria bacterium]